MSLSAINKTSVYSFSKPPRLIQEIFFNETLLLLWFTH